MPEKAGRRSIAALIGRGFGLKFPLPIPFVSCLREFATLETIVGEPVKKERLESEAVKQKSAVLIAQFSWWGHAWNATPEEAAQQVVADLYEHLSRGGNVLVHIEELGGKKYALEVAARR